MWTIYSCTSNIESTLKMYVCLCPLSFKFVKNWPNGHARAFWLATCLFLIVSLCDVLFSERANTVLGACVNEIIIEKQIYWNRYPVIGLLHFHVHGKSGYECQIVQPYLIIINVIGFYTIIFSMSSFPRLNLIRNYLYSRGLVIDIKLIRFLLISLICL